MSGSSTGMYLDPTFVRASQKGGNNDFVVDLDALRTVVGSVSPLPAPRQQSSPYRPNARIP